MSRIKIRTHRVDGTTSNIARTVLDWTPARITLLRECWPDASATVIAKRIGDGCTRNAVLGKAFRLGLPCKDTKGIIRQRRSRKTAQNR